MKILVSGATGFIGQNLVRSLIKNDLSVHLVVRKNSDISFLDTNVKTIVYDGDIDSLKSEFKKESFDGVIHLASLFLASHESTDISNLIFSNITFGTELLECSKESNVKWFINTGTFWQNYQSDSYNPVNLYAATKEAFENIAKFYTQTSDLIFTTIKLNDTFGPNDTRNKVFNLWSKISTSGEVLEMSAGEQIIDISYIDDVIEAYMTLIKHLNSNEKHKFKNETFAVKSAERKSLKELSKVFEEATNTKLNIVWGGREYRDREVMIPWDSGKVVPGWKPKYSLKEAIIKTMENINND